MPRPGGEFRTRIRIEQQALTTDTHGARSVAWALRCVVSAVVEPLSYREAVQAAAVQTGLNTAVTIRYRSDIAITDRILIGSRTLQIQSIQDEDARQADLRLLCTEGQAATLTV